MYIYSHKIDLHILMFIYSIYVYIIYISIGVETLIARMLPSMRQMHANNSIAPLINVIYTPINIYTTYIHIYIYNSVLLCGLPAHARMHFTCTLCFVAFFNLICNKYAKNVTTIIYKEIVLHIKSIVK